VDPIAQVLLALTIILAAAKIAGHVSVRLGQPAVLGELIAGVVLGNLTLIGIDAFHSIAEDPTVDILARLGVVILLFEVGLESTVRDMFKVGWPSLLVAVLGVVTPFALGWGVSAWRLPDRGPYVHAFLGATLTATSVGITARVRLVILAVVSGVITSADRGESMSYGGIATVLGTAFAFLGTALALGVARVNVLGLSALLTLAAIAGKQACSLGALGQRLDRLSIGIGMIPRGEVGLIFANIGLGLQVAGQRIVDEGVFSAVVIMVIVTTIVTPPALKWSLARHPSEHADHPAR
jgi:Kef-type K+ transport system membrane component KefB